MGLFLYSDNESGNFDIKYVHTPRLDWGTYEGQQRLFGPGSVTTVNSAADDLYYSRYINNQWSPPINFGDKINSSSNKGGYTSEHIIYQEIPLPLAVPVMTAKTARGS